MNKNVFEFSSSSTWLVTSASLVAIFFKERSLCADPVTRAHKSSAPFSHTCSSEIRLEFGDNYYDYYDDDNNDYDDCNDDDDAFIVDSS